MKINRFMIGMTIVLIILYIFILGYFSKMNMNSVDVTKVNNVVKSIEKEFDNQQYDISKTGVLDELSYRVVFVEDVDYNATIFNAMKHRGIIADLIDTVEGDESDNKIVGKVIFLVGDNEETVMKKNIIIAITAIFFAIIVTIYFIFGVIYIRILKPFAVMKRFAGKVAEGDLEFKLSMDKNNYFGAFTESFDLMREELIKAKQGEYQANISKKELVAELSHDILTPVATIKAVCELLHVKLESAANSEINRKDHHNIGSECIEKIDIIWNKADVIDKLISNMFHATLEELEMLKVEQSEQPSTIITQMFIDINSFGKIHFKNSVTECLIKCDPLRLSQVIDNVISNSYKYAGTDIEVCFSMNEQDKVLGVIIRDYGSGVDDNELPLICEKFYRGSVEKVKNSVGSGLGLYLAKQFMEGMGGHFTYFNDKGFIVVLQIKIV